MDQVRPRLEAFAAEMLGGLARADQRAKGELYLRGLMLDGKRKVDAADGRPVAVGTALEGGPPHRSQRAGLPHWAPASGSDGQALGWERVHHAAGGSHRRVSRSIRFQFRRERWLRRRSALYQCLPTWVRNAATASMLPCTA